MKYTCLHSPRLAGAEYTYLLGDEVPMDNVEKRTCVNYDANTLSKIDYDVVCQRKYSNGCTWPNKQLPQPGRYCDPVLVGDVHLFDLNATDLRVKDAPPPPRRPKKGPGDIRRDRAMHHLKKVGKKKGVPKE